jgi:DNA mismatch endonuclease Vsr
VTRNRTDHVDATTRSAIMRAVKNRHVRSTELALRARLVAARVRGWRMYADALPGTPDFVFDNASLVVFVHGCFWHGCVRCYRRPKSSQTYWDHKVTRNRVRDRSVARALRSAGWRVLQIWECQLTPANAPRTISRIERALRVMLRA